MRDYESHEGWVRAESGDNANGKSGATIGLALLVVVICEFMLHWSAIG